MLDSGRKKVLAALWVFAGAFLALAQAWPWIAESWPHASAVAQFISGNQLAIDAIGLTIFGLLVWDFRTRRRWLAKNGGGSNNQLLEQKIEQLKGSV
jgi:hypothetical protein